MSSPLAFQHNHEPIYRVVRANWRDPLDATFSQNSVDNRWNTKTFSALYCCCSEPVMIAVAEDILGYAGVDLSDLQPDYLPHKVEISWSGNVVDVITEEGITAIGFPSQYPANVDKSQTRILSEEWFATDKEGVVGRSASLMRKGFTKWAGQHEQWSEVAIFTSNTAIPPTMISRTNLTFTSV